MKKQERKVSQTNLDAISTDSNDSMVEEMTEKEFRMYINKMICEVKDDIWEQMQVAKHYFNKEIEIMGKKTEII